MGVGEPAPTMIEVCRCLAPSATREAASGYDRTVSSETLSILESVTASIS